jgi:hypothetical protein
MRRALLKRRLRGIISEVVSPIDLKALHRCINGEKVTMDSPECVEDLAFRIDDAREDRDAVPTRTDAREHYNGLLRVLRRKLRQSRKLQPEDHI